MIYISDNLSSMFSVSFMLIKTLLVITYMETECSLASGGHTVDIIRKWMCAVKPKLLILLAVL